MSEPGPDSVPTSQDKRSRRPIKKRALTPVSQHAEKLDALFAHPEKQIALPPSSREISAASRLMPPPDIVTNVQGSSAGAGSGEFHVYKASRRREYERIRVMEEEVIKEEADREWEAKQTALKKKEEAKTNKNKAKRDKAKARKEAMKTGTGSSNGDAKKIEKKLGPHKGANEVRRSEDEAENDTENGRPLTGFQVKAVDEIGIVIHDDD